MTGMNEVAECAKKQFSLKVAKSVVFQAKMARMYGSQKRLECRYYFCHKCGSYHVTSKQLNQHLV